MTSYASECTRVYTRRGTRAHLMSPLESPNHSGGVLCSLLPKWPDEWLGTGSQNEIEHAASMPLCKVCEASANRHEWRRRHAPTPTRPAGPPSAGPAAKSCPPGDDAATPGAPPVVPRDGDGAPGASSAPAGLAQGAGEAQASGRQAWKDAIAAHNSARRNRRGTRPAPQIAGVRAALRLRGDGQ